MKINNYSSLQFNNPPQGISKQNYDQIVSDCTSMQNNLLQQNRAAASQDCENIEHKIFFYYDSGAINREQYSNLTIILDKMEPDIDSMNSQQL